MVLYKVPINVQKLYIIKQCNSPGELLHSCCEGGIQLPSNVTQFTNTIPVYNNIREYSTL